MRTTLKLSSDIDFPTESNNCWAILSRQLESWACWSQNTPAPLWPCFQWYTPAIYIFLMQVSSCCEQQIISIKYSLNISIVIRKIYLQNLLIYISIFLLPVSRVLITTDRDDENVIRVIDINNKIIYFLT